jgi:hypothetical protein
VLVLLLREVEEVVLVLVASNNADAAVGTAPVIAAEVGDSEDDTGYDVDNGEETEVARRCRCRDAVGGGSAAVDAVGFCR